MKTIERLFRESARIKKAMVAKACGQWIPLEKEIGLYECSICGHKILRAECNYCPNCGADMRGEEVVRCKDCKWFGDIGCAIRIVDDSDRPSENDFCSFAERKDNG